MVSAVVGLVTLLSALILGLLIWTARGVYAGQNTAVQTFAAKVLQLDMALKDYGPDAKPARLQLREGVAKTVDEIWRADLTDSEFAADSFAAALRNMRAEEVLLDHLCPTTDEQKAALSTAKAALDAMGQSRLQISFALSAPISYAFVYASSHGWRWGSSGTGSGRRLVRFR
jgi:hypothetical protein